MPRKRHSAQRHGSSEMRNATGVGSCSIFTVKGDITFHAASCLRLMAGPGLIPIQRRKFARS